MELKPNSPFDTRAIARLIDDPEDMHLVWPKARWPFDHAQWRRALDPSRGHFSLLVMEGRETIGHAALRATAQPSIYAASYLYLRPQWREKGVGQRLMALLESFSGEHLQARQLDLVVRDYNPRAMSCYQKCGFHITGRDGSLIHMSKELASGA